MGTAEDKKSLRFRSSFSFLVFMAQSSPLNRNSSATPPLQVACNTTLYYLELGSRLPSVKSMVGTSDNAEMVLNPGVRVVIQLVLMYHMRVSECLDVCARDEIKPTIFLIRAKKRGANYTIHIPVGDRNRTILDHFTPGQLLFPFSYHKIWRSMVAAGMSMRVTTRVNRIVTHRGRFDLAEKLVKLNETSNITPLLHHKSPKSMDYYLPSGEE